MLRVNTPGRDDHSSVLRRVGCVSGGSSSNDLELTECVSNKVKYQHDNNHHGVKTLARQLCSSRARSSISPHIRAPPSLRCLCDRQRGLWATYLNRPPTRACRPGLEVPRDELLQCAARGYTDIGRTSAAAQLHNQGHRSRGNRSCGITQGDATSRATNSTIPKALALN